MAQPIMSCFCNRIKRPVFIVRKLYSAVILHKNDTDSSNDLPNVTQSEFSSRNMTRSDKISYAMLSYMDKVKEKEKFLLEKNEEYEIGKRHLANIMGVELESLDEAAIDKALAYLFPSGLFATTARPVMKHPSKIFHKIKEASFGLDGRPHHYLFYTTRQNFYSIMHDMTEKLQNLKAEETKMLMSGFDPSNFEKPFNTKESVCVTIYQLKSIVLEDITYAEYDKFLLLMSRLCDHPLAAREQEFIMKYRIPQTPARTNIDTIPICIDGDGREYSEANGARKNAEATVKVFKNGRGLFSVNGVDHLYEYFPNVIDRLQLMTPLKFCDLLGKVDVVATVRKGGPAGQAGAIRLALSRSLTSFMSAHIQERMRLAGLLTKDPRIRERQKPGMRGARRKKAWRKR